MTSDRAPVEGDGFTSGQAEERKGCRCGRPGPRCEYHFCGKPADWSAMAPTWKRNPIWAPKFFCDSCWKYFQAAMAKPLKGIDRPADAPEDWRGSLMEHLHWCRIEMEHEDRLERERAGHDAHEAIAIEPRLLQMRGWTPAQIGQAKLHRHLMRKFQLGAAYGR